jgi:hypothetical protein
MTMKCYTCRYRCKTGQSEYDTDCELKVCPYQEEEEYDEEEIEEES